VIVTNKKFILTIYKTHLNTVFQELVHMKNCKLKMNFAESTKPYILYRLVTSK